MSSDAVFDRRLFCLAEGNLLEQPQRMLLALKQQSFGGLFRHIDVSLGTSHAMLTLLKEIVGAVAVAEIVELPWLRCGTPTADHILIHKYLDGAKVARKVAGVGIGFGHLQRRDLRVMLSC